MLWSRHIRAGGVCERCFSNCGPAVLQAAHIVPRRHFSTRWDLRNGLGLCADCHRWLDTNPHDGRAWVRQRIGAGTLRTLEKQAQEPWDRDYDRIIAELKEIR
jgi:hypothetical protein